MKGLKITLAVCLVASLLVGGLANAKEWKNRAHSGLPPLSKTGEVMGDTGHPQEAHKTFRLVRYRGAQRWSSPLSAGSMVVWHTGALTGDGVTVTDSILWSGDTRVAGVMVTGVLTSGAGKTGVKASQQRSLNVTADIRNYGSWGWLQTFGKARIRCATNAKASKDSVLIASVHRGKGGCKRTWWKHQYLGQAKYRTGEARVIGAAGFWMDTETTSSRDVFLRCE